MYKLSLFYFLTNVGRTFDKYVNCGQLYSCTANLYKGLNNVYYCPSMVRGGSRKK